MRTVIVICSADRPQTLHETVAALVRQTIAPAAILLSLCDQQSLLDETARLPLVRVIYGLRGLTKQRNTSLSELPAETPVLRAVWPEDDPDWVQGDVRDLLARFGLTGDIGLKPALGLALASRLLLTGTEVLPAVPLLLRRRASTPPSIREA